MLAAWRKYNTKQFGGLLKKYGLRHEDLYLQNICLPDINDKTKHLISEESRNAHQMRVFRAQELDMKHIYLPSNIQAAHEPFVYSEITQTLDDMVDYNAARDAYFNSKKNKF